MRITPLAVWCYKLSDQDLLTAVKLQTYLTHCHPLVVEACYLYCLAIKQILNGPDQIQGVYQSIRDHAMSRGILSEWFEAIEKGELPPVSKHIGWSKIAFCYTFYYLKNGTKYEQAIEDILNKGGDTDTNAAIIGGVLGAA